MYNLILYSAAPSHAAVPVEDAAVCVRPEGNLEINKTHFNLPPKGLHTSYKAGISLRRTRGISGLGYRGRICDAQLICPLPSLAYNIPYM